MQQTNAVQFLNLKSLVTPSLAGKLPRLSNATPPVCNQWSAPLNPSKIGGGIVTFTWKQLNRSILILALKSSRSFQQYHTFDLSGRGMWLSQRLTLPNKARLTGWWAVIRRRRAARTEHLEIQKQTSLCWYLAWTLYFISYWDNNAHFSRHPCLLRHYKWHVVNGNLTLRDSKCK